MHEILPGDAGQLANLLACGGDPRLVSRMRRAHARNSGLRVVDEVVLAGNADFTSS
jgi:hypothetical protein